MEDLTKVEECYRDLIACFARVKQEVRRVPLSFARLPELIPGLPAVGEVDRLGILIEAERAVRRCGLHRVAEGLQAGLSREELTKLVTNLLSESKARQVALHKQMGKAQMSYFWHASK